MFEFYFLLFKYFSITDFFLFYISEVKLKDFRLSGDLTDRAF